MNTRILPPNEWFRLVGTEAEHLWPLMNPRHDAVVAIEADDGELIGCVPMFFTLTADCVWIAPDHRRKGSVARLLWDAVRNYAVALKAGSINIPVTEDVMHKFCERVGATKLNAEMYVWALKQGRPS